MSTILKKIKLFAPRDLHILHFIITILLAVSTIYCLIYINDYRHFVEEFYTQDHHQINSRLHNLEKHIGKKYQLSQDGTYSLVDDIDVKNSDSDRD